MTPEENRAELDRAIAEGERASRVELIRQYFRFAAWVYPDGIPPGWEEDVARGEAPP